MENAPRAKMYLASAGGERVGHCRGCRCPPEGNQEDVERGKRKKRLVLLEDGTLTVEIIDSGSEDEHSQWDTEEDDEESTDSERFYVSDGEHPNESLDQCCERRMAEYEEHLERKMPDDDEYRERKMAEYAEHWEEIRMKWGPQPKRRAAPQQERFADERRGVFGPGGPIFALSLAFVDMFPFAVICNIAKWWLIIQARQLDLEKKRKIFTEPTQVQLKQVSTYLKLYESDYQEEDERMIAKALDSMWDVRNKRRV